MDTEHGAMSTDQDGKPLLPGPESGNKARNGSTYIFHFETPKIVVWFAAAAVLGYLFLHFFSSPQILSHYNSFSLASFGGRNESPTPEEKTQDLSTLLKNAANEDNIVMITTLNKPWAEPNSIFDLFLESFRIGDRTQKLLSHLVVITLDKQAHARCLKIHSYCYALDTNGMDFSGIAHHMKPDYLEMMWRRLQFLLSVLELGYNFIFTDTDILWLRDPFPRFHLDGDFQVSCDHYGGNPSDMTNSPNTGVQFVRSNERSIEFYKYWIAARERFPGLKEQDVLNKIKFDPFFNQMGVQVRFLNTAYFGGICEYRRELSTICTMHANCCVGLGNKVNDLGVMIQQWKKYLAWENDRTLPKDNTFNVPQHCINSTDN